MENNLFVKNMVCPRCIESVTTILESLGIPFMEVVLGRIGLEQAPDFNTTHQLKEELEKAGFQLLESEETQLVNAVKTFIIEQIHYKKDVLSGNWSAILSKQFHKDYSTLSKSFSKSTSITIEKYIILQKIERAKELLTYPDYTLSIIADELGYSSKAHFSTQFKKIVGVSPSVYRNGKMEHRRSLDEL